ncbi:hypothetical protein GCM10007359_02460 [Rothia aerolata]|uniref:Uncharacterized protein n=1 Tax=Rothia aerolata TaxID=1812262 RepID=A0A917MS48_9MICC|nr:hypothetical protein GCM10007359_02460 [Rothia aerolata]
MVGFLPSDKAGDYSSLIRKARGKGLCVITTNAKASYSINKDGEPIPSVSIGILTPKQLSDLLG